MYATCVQRIQVEIMPWIQMTHRYENGSGKRVRTAEHVLNDFRTRSNLKHLSRLIDLLIYSCSRFANARYWIAHTFYIHLIELLFVLYIQSHESFSNVRFYWQFILNINNFGVNALTHDTNLILQQVVKQIYLVLLRVVSRLSQAPRFLLHERFWVIAKAASWFVWFSLSLEYSIDGAAFSINSGNNWTAFLIGHYFDLLEYISIYHLKIDLSIWRW